MKEVFHLSAAAEERRVNVLCGERGCKCKIATGDPLRQAKEIGLNVLVRTSKQLPGPPKSGRNLVDDRVYAKAPTHLDRFREKSRRVHEHSRRTLDHRLEDERRYLVRTSLELLFEPAQRCAAIAA